MELKIEEYHMRTFKKYLMLRENKEEWKDNVFKLPKGKGFVPPNKLKPVIRAFIDSDKIKIMDDAEEAITMPKKTLYLVGGPVRDLIAGSTIKDYDLATNATPQQIGIILSAAGFKFAGDRSGGNGKELHLPQGIQDRDGRTVSFEKREHGDTHYWYIKGRDSSPERKAFVIGAVVDGEEFDLATFRKDMKVEKGKAEVGFSDNPYEDAIRRDFTINSMYIELNNPDGENNKLYDPTGSGYHDLKNKVVRTVGDPKERFEEDPLRTMRFLRMHSKFAGDNEPHKETSDALKDFSDLHKRIPMERIRDEFLKGLKDKSIDVVKYLNLLKKSGMINSVFPGITFSDADEFVDGKNKLLTIAWMLKGNSPEKIKNTLMPKMNIDGNSKNTGWLNQERNDILFLIALLHFNKNDHSYISPMRLLSMKKMSMLTNEQLIEWGKMFETHYGNKSVLENIQKLIKMEQEPRTSWEDVVSSGRHIDQFGREIDKSQRSNLISSIESERFKNY